MRKYLKAGTAISDISPGKGIELGGYPHYPRHNTGVHDPLYAGCIYLENEKEKIALVSLDLLFFSKKYVKEVREKAARLTGIPEGNIVIGCSHTHSGPWASGRLDIEALEKDLKPDCNYLDDLKEKIVSIIVEAYSNTFDARIGIQKGYCGKEQGVGGNRREPDGPADPEVCVLAIQDLNGIWRACLVNYALHPTVLHAESTVVSADYPGYIRKYLTQEKPGMNMLFMQGTSGNQSTRYFRSAQTFEEAERIGVQIGREVDGVLGSMSLQDSPELFVNSTETDIKIRKFPPLEDAQKAVDKAKETLEELKEAGAPYIEIQNADLKLLGAEDILGYILMLDKGQRIELLEDETPVEIQVIGIGEARIACMPGEIFVEFGIDIKKKSPYKDTFVVELANGCLPGYVYTKDALQAGGYETDTSMLAPETGYVFVETVLNMLNK
jgi:neutral ceramidase